MNKEMPSTENKKTNEEEKKESPLGYIEGSGGALTPYWTEEERLKILEDIKENQG